MLNRVLVVIAATAALSVLADAVRAEDTERRGVQSYGMRAAYGSADRDHLQFATLLPRVSWFFPHVIDAPLAKYDCQGELIVEPIISYINGNHTETVEAGANLVFFSLRYDRGQALVPFLEGGEGVLFTDLRGENLGTRFQFSSQGGGGLHWFFNQTTAITASYRLRHISNAGITNHNSGLNTDFFTVGITYFPKR